jgi:Skp family chaperone for outer membrane proteins
MMKILAAALTASAIALPTAAVAQRAPAAVIVVVDNGRIFEECTACRAAVTQLQTQATQLQSRQQALVGPLRTEAQSIQTAAEALKGAQPGAALQARARALQTRQDAANAELQRLQQNLQSSQQNVRRQIEARLGPIISSVMTARGANVAVDTEATLARSPSLDVTNEVLAQLNTQLPAVSVTPLPQQAAPQGR